MTAKVLREKFITFFEDKGHKRIPSAPLVPENDPSTLFISAGIQPLVPYFLGKKHPFGARLVNVQKCMRTGDIDEVGDVCHHTFFEMLGNWSLGDYFKKEAISWSFELLTKTLNIPIDKLAISCFAGNQDTPKDEEAASLWRQQGISPERIAFLEDNWWGPPGITGPCGSDTEMFYWVGDEPAPQIFDPQDNRWIEFWNDVLIQYYKNDQAKYEKLVQNNIDTGMGVERTITILNGFSDDYLTTIWQPIIKAIEDITQKKYSDPLNQKPMRIIADHIRSAVFIIADGVEPSNKEAGYVLRRLIRRAVRQGKLLGVDTNFLVKVAIAAINNQKNYAGDYPELNHNRAKIIQTINTEEKKFRLTLDKGLKRITDLIDKNKTISGREAFDLYQTYGFPVEMIAEELNKNGLTLNQKEYETAKDDHSKQSKTLSAGHYKAGLADSSETVTKYHTATHLLHQALRLVLGEHVHQAGSNITGERLRFDFIHSEKLTDEQIKQIEGVINRKIQENLIVHHEEMDKNAAIANGALAFFPEKYPQIANVYTIGDKDNWFSKELCGGPHVKSTGVIGPVKIVKQEASGSGIRRLYLQLVK